MIARAAILAVSLALPAVAAAAGPDAAEGRKLVESNKCEACHQDKVHGPPGTIYLRKDRRVTNWAKLKSQVALCNSELGIGLFPEDELAVAAYLNDAWYRFPAK
jgi:hypothetical protein